MGVWLLELLGGGAFSRVDDCTYKTLHYRYRRNDAPVVFIVS